MKIRILAAAAIAALGTTVLAMLRLFLGFVGPQVIARHHVIACAISAFFLSLIILPTRDDFVSVMSKTLLLVFGTFGGIAIGHAAVQRIAGGQGDFEPLGILLWATVLTSWWLLPIVFMILRSLSRPSHRSKSPAA